MTLTATFLRIGLGSRQRLWHKRCRPDSPAGSRRAHAPGQVSASSSFPMAWAQRFSIFDCRLRLPNRESAIQNRRWLRPRRRPRRNRWMASCGSCAIAARPQPWRASVTGTVAHLLGAPLRTRRVMECGVSYAALDPSEAVEVARPPCEAALAWVGACNLPRSLKPIPNSLWGNRSSRDGSSPVWGDGIKPTVRLGEPWDRNPACVLFISLGQAPEVGRRNCEAAARPPYGGFRRPASGAEKQRGEVGRPSRPHGSQGIAVGFIPPPAVRRAQAIGARP